MPVPRRGCGAVAPAHAQQDVRAFLEGGFAALGNVDGDLEPRGRRFLLSWAAFETEFLPTLTPHDVVVGIAWLAPPSAALERLAEAARLRGVQTALVSVTEGAAVQVRVFVTGIRCHNDAGRTGVGRTRRHCSGIGGAGRWSSAGAGAG